ncbi:MAG: hypothetical protein ABMB14_36355 [Myxococcota bacterium]
MVERLLDDPGARWGTMPAVRRALRAIATPRTVALIVDDGPACPDVIRLARALIGERGTHPARILVVVTAEDDAVTALPELETALDGAPGVDVIHLGPLGASAQEALLGSLVGLDPEAHSVVPRGRGRESAAVLGRDRPGASRAHRR